MDVAEAGGFILTMLAPTLLVGAGVLLPRAVRAVRRQVRRRRAPDIAPPSRPPIEQLAADLRRLLQRHDALRRSTEMAMRARHLRAVEAAIGDCATEAALALGLPVALRSGPDQPLAVAELRRLLRELADAGLVLVPASGLLAADDHG